MRTSCLQRLGRHIKLKFQISVLSRGVGGKVKSKLKLNSAKAEAKASSLSLAISLAATMSPAYACTPLHSDHIGNYHI